MNSHAAALPRNEASGRFIVNVGSSLIYVVLNTGIMFWYIPFLLKHLGVAAYGMVPLSSSLVMFAMIVCEGVNGAIYRNLAIDLNRGELFAAQRTFNSAVMLTIAVSCFLLVPMAPAVWLFPQLFAVPPDLESAARFLLAGSFFTALTFLIGSPFDASSLITHRFDIRNAIRSAVALSRVGIVALCFYVWPASLMHVGLGMFASALLGLGGCVIAWHRLTPQLRLRLTDVDSHHFRPLLNIGAWSAVNTAGMLLLMQVDLIIVNALFGSTMTGRYGALLAFAVLMHTLAEVVTPIFSPMIMARYAIGDVTGVRRLLESAVGFLAFGLALPVGLLCGLGRPLLSLWLGPDFAELDTLLAVLVAHLAVNLAGRPIGYLLTAHNKVKQQGLVTLALGVVNIVLAVALALWAKWGVLGVAAATAIVWTLKNTLILPVYAARVLGLDWWAFLPRLAGGAAAVLGIALACRALAAEWPPLDWISLAAMASAISALYLIILIGLIIRPDDRKLISRLILRRAHD
ncbi:lipopolysaccharide biosynthesis protein [Bosea sp. NPDC055353]